MFISYNLLEKLGKGGSLPRSSSQMGITRILSAGEDLLKEKSPNGTCTLTIPKGNIKRLAAT